MNFSVVNKEANVIFVVGVCFVCQSSGVERRGVPGRGFARRVYKEAKVVVVIGEVRFS